MPPIRGAAGDAGPKTLTAANGTQVAAYAARAEQARAILSQVGALLLVNLVFTFAIPGISWTGHIGGLLIGGLIGLVLAPTNVPTLGGVWRSPDGSPAKSTTPVAGRAGAYLLISGILAAGAFIAVNQVV